MKFDVGLSWANSVDEEFARMFLHALKEERFSYIEATPLTMESLIEDTLNKKIEIRTYVDRASDDFSVIRSEILRMRKKCKKTRGSCA